jgi:glucokinase-like ROK family protein
MMLVDQEITILVSRNGGGMFSHIYNVQNRRKWQIVDNGCGTQRADLHAIRAFNRLLILNYVRKHGPVARVAIARVLGLSRTTVSSIIDELLQARIVREGSFLNAAPQGGRRAILVHFEADAGHVLGIDIGRSHLTLIVTNLEASLIAQKTFPFTVDQGAEAALQLVLSSVREFANEVGLCWENVIGIGVAIPGPLDAGRRCLNSVPHMPGWAGVNIWEVFHQEFAVPIWIDRDANMGAIGEHYCGAGQQHDDMAYIKIGTGIGSGLLLNGHIYRGHNGSAGEIGHLTIQENGTPCSCGNSGCLETVAVVPFIVSDASQGRTLAQRQCTHHSTNVELVEPIQARRNLDEVLHAARQGEAASLAALEQAGAHIGVALASLINIFNPSAIIIDGGIARQGEIFLDSLQRSAAEASLPSAWQGTSIIAGSLGQLSVAIGAVYTVINSFFDLPDISPRSPA